MYNKLFGKIVDSSIWLESTPTRIVWLTFIAVMDESGFVQFAAIGNVANRARVTMEEAEAAIKCLEEPDDESGDPSNDGRRIERVPGGWMVLNAEKHRQMVTRAIIQEQTRERVRRHREKKRTGNASVTPSDTDTEVQPEEKKRSAPPALPRPQPIQARRRKDAAWEGPRVYVPQRCHSDFVALRNGAEPELLAWYGAVSEEWTDGSRRAEEPGADMFTFWKARYAEKWPSAARTSDRRPAWLQRAKPS